MIFKLEPFNLKPYLEPASSVVRKDLIGMGGVGTGTGSWGSFMFLK